MDRNIAVRLGRNIASVRRAAKLTQAEVAERAEIDNVSLSRIERGIVTPSISTLNRIANALHEPIGRLFDGATSQTVSVSNSIATLLESLSDDDRLFMLQLMQLMTDRLRSKKV